MRKTIF